MKTIEGRMYLEWSDGGSAEIGRITLEPRMNDMRVKMNPRAVRRRIGRELVKLGLRMMFRRPEEEACERQDTDQQD